MTALALAFLVVYAVPILAPGLPGGLAAALHAANLAIWVTFAVDLAFRVRLSERRLAYLRSHPVDVLAVALPSLRPLRVLRVFTAGQSLMTRGRQAVAAGQAAVITAAVLILVGALAMLDAERDATGATVTTFGSAMWWAMTTVTTVGYGDTYPVTGLGRAVAASLMVVGISVLGVVTATVAAWFVSRGEDEAERDAAQSAELRALDERLCRIERALERLAEVPAPRTGPGVPAWEDAGHDARDQDHR